MSLSPAITETLVRLDMDDLLVGRTPWCVSTDASVPIVGDLMEVDAERLIEVGPTIVLVQPPRSGVEAGLAALTERHGWTLRQWRIDGVDDIVRVLDELPGAVLPAGPRLDAAVAEAKATRASIEASLVADERIGATGRTLLLFSIDPPMAFGVGSYLGEVLQRLGGRNAVTVRGFPQISLEDIVRMAPDTVVLVGALGRDDQARQLLGRLGVPADPGRFVILDDPAALVPGPSVGRVAKLLRDGLVQAASSETAP